MYGLVDFFVAQEIIHIIGRKQAEQEGRVLVKPERVSLVRRLVNRLPLWTANQSLKLETSQEEASLNTVQCE